LAVFTHASNVCGIKLPVKELCEEAHRKGIITIVDCAQSAGTHTIDIKKAYIDALCCPGHKGLYGPQGTGFVLFSDKYSDEKSISKLRTFVHGGNGVNSAENYMPPLLPERYEGGTLNTPGIAGLVEGIKFVNAQSAKDIFSHCSLLYNKAINMLYDIPDIVLYCPDIKYSSTLLFNINNIPSDIAADYLSSDGICVRGGLHCSPLAHKKLMTENGAVRVSLSCFNTASELDNLYRSLKNIIKTKK